MTSENPANDDLRQRQKDARAEIDKLDANSTHSEPERKAFFNTVYQLAEGDAVKVPWADLQAKAKLLDWLKGHNGSGLTALDVACGLGDNAEAMAAAGYQTTGFDVAEDAIPWAKKRFPESTVSYVHADLFKLPSNWQGGFDLVHECYTLQALSPQLLPKTTEAIASLVKPGGTLLVYTRIAHETLQQSGPPWPLTKAQAEAFSNHGFELIAEDQFTINRPDRRIPHGFYEWKKNI